MITNHRLCAGIRRFPVNLPESIQNYIAFFIIYPQIRDEFEKIIYSYFPKLNRYAYTGIKSDVFTVWDLQKYQNYRLKPILRALEINKHIESLKD